MSKSSFAKTSFSAGVLGPRVSRRVDTQHYFNGASVLENVICLPWGGIERTPGTIFVQEVRDSSKPARLLDFVFNRRQAYLLQLNDSKIRFYKDKGTVFTAGGGVVITDITNANPGVVTTASAHGLSNGDIVTMQEVDGMGEVNGVEYTVANKTSTTFELSGIDTSGFGTFIPHTGTVLLLHFNNNLTDSSSTTPHTVSAVGDAAASSTKSKFGGYSLYLDGTGDYLTIPDDADWDFGASDFCIDFWVYFETATGDICFIDRNSGNDFRVAIESGNLVCYLEGTSYNLGAWAPSTGEWYHVAVSREGTDLRAIIQGILNGSDTSSDNVAGTAGLYIGATSGGSNLLHGYIDEFRITKGYARFTTSSGFSADSYTKLLLKMEGSDASTTFTDSETTPKTVTANGNAQIDTDQFKIGSASGLFDGSGDYLSLADHDDWDFGTGDWCMEAFIRVDSFSTNSAQIVFDNGGFSNGVMVVVQGTSLTVYIKGSNFSNTFTITEDAWHHIAVYRYGNTCYAAFNGQVGATTYDATSLNITGLTAGLWIGWRVDSFSGQEFVGWMDEVRVTKGYSRYTSSNFNTPSGVVPDEEGFEQATVGGIYEISHSYDDDEIFDIQKAQSADIMYLFHADHPTMKLSRFGDDDWTLEEVDWIDGPYLDTNTTATTLDPDGTSGTVTVTASATTGINDGDGIKSTDVGRLISYNDGTSQRYLKITAFTSTTEVDATVEGGTSLAGHAATTNWALGAWSATTGYPRTGTFHKGRLYAAGTATQPQHIWGSVVSDFENMLAGSDDDDAVIIPLDTDKNNIIEWIASEKRLIVGTAQENFTVYSGFTNEPITPSNIQADPETSYGASTVTPKKIGSLLYYMDADNRKLREFSYAFDIDRYRSVNKSILSDEITGTGIVEIAYQQSPYGILYCVRDDGKMATFTREIDQQIESWTLQTTDGSYKSVAVIPVTGYDEAWFIVERTINGETKKYVEYQQNPYQAAQNDLEDQILMHSALTYDGSPTTSVSGLEHLEGESVIALCDGTEVEGIVTNGVLPLNGTYSVVHVGKEPIAKIKILEPESASATGTAQGLMKRVNQIMVSVYRTAALKVGEDGGNMEEVLRNSLGELLTTLQTGDFLVPNTIGWDTKSEVYFEIDGALPCTLLLVVYYMTASEK